MPLVVPAFGTADISVPASGAIAVASRGRFDVFQVLTGAPNQAPTLVLLNSQAANPSGGTAQYTSSAFTSAATVRVQATGGYPANYSVGTNPVVSAAVESLGDPRPINPSNFQAINVSATATVAQLFSGGITSTTAAAVVVTAPTAALIDLAGTFAVGESFDVLLINTGGTNALSISGGTGNTYLGTISTTAGGMTARFVKTAAGAYTVYRV
jgi:hypothetical protein